MNVRYVAIGVFLLLAAAVWRPFHAHRGLYATARPDAVPAGEITQGFTLRQEVVLPRTLPLDGATGFPDRQPCFGIQFATWARANKGHVDVQWRQGEKHQQWRVDMSHLADNTFRHYCPDTGFYPYQPFTVEINGVDGSAGSSATLWLVGDTHFGTARLGDDSIPGKSIALQVSSRREIRLPSSLATNHGIFALGWLCSLAVGLIALLVAFRNRQILQPIGR